MKYQFMIEGQMPGGKNDTQTTQTGRRYPNPKGRFLPWRRDAALQLKAQGIYNQQLAHPLRISISYTRQDNRRRDVPGMEDALWHVLEKTVKFVQDDYWFWEVHWYPKKCNHTQPRIICYVEPIEEEI